MKIKYLLLFIFLQVLFITCRDYGLHYGGFYFAILEDESIEIIALSKTQRELETLRFPSTIYGKKVTKINLNSEEGKKLKLMSGSSSYEAKKVIVPSSIKTIESYCFDFSQDIESVLFKDVRGWYLTYKNKDGELINLDLDLRDPKENALMLRRYSGVYFYDPLQPNIKLYYNEFTWHKK